MFPVNDYSKQLADLQARLANPPISTVPTFLPSSQIKYVDGLDGAKEFQSKLPPNSSEIIMDKNDDVFYVISKDANGETPKRMQIGRFTLETEEATEPQYITKNDLDAFEQRIINLLKEKSE